VKLCMNELNRNRCGVRTEWDSVYSGMRPTQQQPEEMRMNAEYGRTAQQEGRNTQHG
jgi:hypothetical protein